MSLQSGDSRFNMEVHSLKRWQKSVWMKSLSRDVLIGLEMPDISWLSVDEGT